MCGFRDCICAGSTCRFDWYICRSIGAIAIFERSGLCSVHRLVSRPRVAIARSPRSMSIVAVQAYIIVVERCLRKDLFVTVVFVSF